jgi:uncharacterized membrane protein
MNAVIAAAALAAASASSSAACTSSDGSSSGTSDAGSCPEDLPPACPSPAPSYAKDVAPVIQSSCTPCHAAGGQQQSRLLTDYAHVFAQRSAVLNQVHACKMPPSNGPLLTAEGRKVLLAWLVCGARND